MCRQFTPPTHTSAGNAFRQLQNVNVAGVDNLREQVRNTVAPDVGDELDTLWRDAGALVRRISMIHTIMRDL